MRKARILLGHLGVYHVVFICISNASLCHFHRPSRFGASLG